MTGKLTNQADSQGAHQVEKADALPRFLLAKTRLPLLKLNVQISLYLVAAMFIGAIIIYLLDESSLWLTLLCNNAAAVILLVMTIKLASQIDGWRNLQLEQTIKKTVENTSANKSAATDDSAKQDELDIIEIIRCKIITYLQIDVVCVAVFSFASLLFVYVGWNTELTPVLANKSSYAAAGLLTVCALGVLVAERYLFSLTRAQWPEATEIGFMARLVILVLFASAALLFLLDENRHWPLLMLAYLGLLPTAIAIELMIRAICRYITTSNNPSEQSLVGKSWLASFLSWPPRPMKLLQNELHQHFGIDLQQVWAFSFIKRVFLPILSVTVLTSWLLSSLTVIPLNARGIYEKFGKPVAVLPSGIHTGLPWPFGRVIMVENGVIHDISTSNAPPSSLPSYTFTQQSNHLDEAEAQKGYAPDSANRLWDLTHDNEKSQLIASKVNQKQSFHILNMDVKAIYRIGLSDKQALNSVYNNHDNPTLIQHLLERILVHSFSSRTLDDALVLQRDQLTADIMQQLQSQLDELNTGIEIMSVVIEAIHPPSGAANAYHAVQAAQITTQVLISKEQSNAITLSHDAKINARQLIYQSESDAQKAIANANADNIKFESEQLAWKQARAAFIMEYYFNKLSRAFTQVKPPLLIIDQRLKIDNSPTIDWRRYLPPADLPSTPNALSSAVSTMKGE